MFFEKQTFQIFQFFFKIHDGKAITIKKVFCTFLDYTMRKKVSTLKKILKISSEYVTYSECCGVAKRFSTSFSVVTFTNAGIGPKNILTFSFNTLATLG